MKTTVVLCFLLACCAMAQEAEADTTCRQAQNWGNRLVGYCEVRHTWAPLTGDALKVRIPGSGSIVVTAWDEPGVQLRAEVHAAGRSLEQAAGIAASVAIDTITEGSVTGAGPRPASDRQWSLRLELRVPRNVAVTLDLINGSLRVDDWAKGVTAVLTNGNVTLSKVTGDVNVRAVNGNVTLGVSRWTSQTVDLSLTNGNLTLELPAEANAHVDLQVINGRITGDVPDTRKETSFDVGEGGPALRARLTNGQIRFSLR